MKSQAKKRRSICVVTGSRAEYGLLYGLMRQINNDSGLILKVVVTGMHLERRFGLTYRQILKDGFCIDAKVHMGLVADTDVIITSSAGRALKELGRVFARLRPDIVVLLGDRFEILAAAVAATLMRLPIAHIHGGEITEGAYDDIIRHSITKMAQLHFVTHADHARRVIQMGESPRRVFTVGALGLDNIKNLHLLPLEELERNLGFRLGGDVALITFHPVTLQKGAAERQVKHLLSALEKSGLRCIFTMPNADPENEVIRREILKFVARKGGLAKAVNSLGSLHYLSLMRYVALMVGNSSSGLIEAPSFRLPVVNIGDRQKGRLRAANVIDVPDDADKIVRAIRHALSTDFRGHLKNLKNPYGDDNTALRIKKVLKRVSLRGILIKPFQDIYLEKA